MSDLIEIDGVVEHEESADSPAHLSGNIIMIMSRLGMARKGGGNNAVTKS